MIFDKDHDIIGNMSECLKDSFAEVRFISFPGNLMSVHPAEKPGAAPAPAETPAAAPAKKQDNLFFIEEPKPARVTESER